MAMSRLGGGSVENREKNKGGEENLRILQLTLKPAT